MGWLGSAKRAVKLPIMAACSRPPLSHLICWRGSRAAGAVALTFDDGPDPVHTPLVLEVLARHRAVGTFFVLGRQVERHPELVERIARAGHEIGVHGFDHTRAGLPRQTRQTSELLLALGVRTRLFRPPGGHLDPRTLSWMVKQGFRTVMWSFDTVDSMRHEGKVRRTIRYDELAGGDIVLMHDDNPICVAELGQALALLAGQGLAARAVSEVVQ